MKIKKSLLHNFNYYKNIYLFQEKAQKYSARVTN